MCCNAPTNTRSGCGCGGRCGSGGGGGGGYVWWRGSEGGRHTWYCRGHGSMMRVLHRHRHRHLHRHRHRHHTGDLRPGHLRPGHLHPWHHAMHAMHRCVPGRASMPVQEMHARVFVQNKFFYACERLGWMVDYTTILINKNM